MSQSLGLRGDDVQYRRIHLGVVLLAFLVRGIWALGIPVVLISDCVAYDHFAQNLAAGLGYCWEAGRPTAYWAVGPAFLFSDFYRIFGHTYTPIVVLNVILGTASVALTIGLTKRYFGAATATVAGLLLALWPGQVEFTTVLASETPFLTFMLLGWWFWEADELPRVPRVLGMGLAFAASCYIRPNGLLVPCVLTLGSVVSGRRLRSVLLDLTLTYAVMAVCIAPWTYRNYQTFGKPVLISANAGVNAWMGNSPGTNGMYRPEPRWEGVTTEVELDAISGAVARKYILDHPWWFVGRTFKKLYLLHERESIGVAWNSEGLKQRIPDRAIFALKLYTNLYWWGCLGAALLALGILVRDEGWVAMLFQPATLIWGYFAGIHSIMMVLDRYHYPMVPSIAILAAVAVVRSRRKSAVPTGNSSDSTRSDATERSSAEGPVRITEPMHS